METVRRILEVDRHEINYLRITIESYDRMAVVSTLDADMAMIELRIAPGCESFIDELLYSLKTDEGVKVEGRDIFWPGITI